MKLRNVFDYIDVLDLPATTRVGEARDFSVPLPAGQVFGVVRGDR